MESAQPGVDQAEMQNRESWKAASGSRIGAAYPLFQKYLPLSAAGVILFSAKPVLGARMGGASIALP
jgi:hypothetical protein